MHLRQPVEGMVSVTRRTRDTNTGLVSGVERETPSHARCSRASEVLRSSTTLENVDPRLRLTFQSDVHPSVNVAEL